MAGNGSMVRITVGSTDWSAGVQSNKANTQASQQNPNGLPLNSLAWGNNITVRDATLSPRAGWKKLCAFPLGIGLHQESRLYRPDQGFPYIISQIGGRTFLVRVDTDNSIQEVTIAGDSNPPLIDQAWMAQGEQFMVIQDGVSLPLFWDGVFLRRSAGNSVVYGTTSANFVVPAVGQLVDVTLSAPYAGPTNVNILINGKYYQVADSANFITLQNVTSPFAGTTVLPGLEFTIYGQSDTVATTLSSFVIPIVGGTVVVPITAAYAGAGVGDDLAIKGTTQKFKVTAIGVTPPAPNHVYLINLDDTPGATVMFPANLNSIGELPTAECMCYYMGRMWLALGREYIAGDIVRGPSGTAAYGYRDSILKMTENTYLSLGGTFLVPTSAGNIRALAYPSNLNTALGEGQLLVFTREQIYSVNVVPTRAQWAALSEPIQRVAQINFGTTSDRSIVLVNGDMFIQYTDGVRSFLQAIRDFDQWGDVPISEEESRAILLNDRSLLRFGCGICFDNRMLQTCLPYQTDVGVCHRGLMPLNFDLISTLQSKLPPAWEGINEGLAILRTLEGDYGGLQRAFALVRGESGAIEVWELTSGNREDHNDTGDKRVTWSFETPSFTWSNPFQLKELDTIELWLDRLYGQVEIVVEFRPDQHPCWERYWEWTDCAPRNECEDPGPLLPCDYPQQRYKMQYRATVVLPKPPRFCENSQHRPIDQGYSFQFRITVKGYLRIRGIMVHAFLRDKQPYLSVTDTCKI